MPWNKYEKTKHLKSVKPQIRIRKDGNCFISRAAYDTHFAESEGVVLFYDEDSSRIGFQATNSSEDYVRKLRPVKSKNGSVYGARLSAKSYLEEHGISINKVFDIEVETFEDKPMIVVDLDKGIEIAPTKRKKAETEPNKEPETEEEDPECPPNQKANL